MNRLASVLLAVFLSPAAAVASNRQDVIDIHHVMDAFHEAVISHDGKRLARLFIPEGSTWLNVLSDEAYSRLKSKSPGVAKIRVGSYEEFTKFVSGSKAALDPRHSHVKIQTDGTIGTVYFDFVFLIDGKEQNRGSEAWQLVKSPDGWRIAAIAYSSEPSS